MNMKRIGLSLIGASFAFPLLAANAERPLDAATIMAMQAADIVILGEVHDNARHHQIQAELIESLSPKAVVFEMLDAEQAAKVQITADTDFDTLAKALGWAETGWPDFALYQPIFEKLEGIEVYGAARPRAEIRRAFDEGAAAVMGEDAKHFALDQPLDEAEAARRAELQFEAHCQAMPIEMMGGMVEAQRLRDASFAATALVALAEAGAPVVVITGNGHARSDWGMPAMIANAAPEAQVFSLGIVEPGGSDVPYDAVIETEAQPREDPCAGFGAS